MKKIIGIIFLVVVVLSQSGGVMARTSTDSARVDRRVEIQAQLSEMRAAREEKRAELQERIETKKEEMRATREQKREEFEAKRAQMRDEHKQKILLKLDRSYERINNRWTSHFSNVLEKLTMILGKIEIRAEESGNSEAVTAIATARVSINGAEVEVSGQAAEVYVIEIGDEEKLQEAALVVHGQLKTDLHSLRDEIKGVRNEIHEILQILAGEE